MSKRDAPHFITEYYTERGKVELMIPTDATDDDFNLLRELIMVIEKELKRRADLKTEPQIRCPKCGRTDYIKNLEKDFGVKDDIFKYKCINCNTYIKDEPTTEDCDYCKMTHKYWYEHCGICKHKPKDEPQTYVINPQEPTNDDKCFECDDFFTCGGQCNKIEDEPQTDCAWRRGDV